MTRSLNRIDDYHNPHCTLFKLIISLSSLYTTTTTTTTTAHNKFTADCLTVIVTILSDYYAVVVSL